MSDNSHSSPQPQPPKQQTKKPSLNRSLGRKQRTVRDQQMLTGTHLPPGVGPTSLDAYGSSSWKAEPQRTSRPMAPPPPPKPGLWETIPFLVKLKARFSKSPDNTQPTDSETPASPGFGERMGAFFTRIKLHIASGWAWCTNMLGKGFGWLYNTISGPLGRALSFLARMRDKALYGLDYWLDWSYHKLRGVLGIVSKQLGALFSKLPPLPGPKALFLKLPGVNALTKQWDTWTLQRSLRIERQSREQTIILLNEKDISTTGLFHPEQYGQEVIQTFIETGEAIAIYNEDKTLAPTLIQDDEDAIARLVASKLYLSYQCPFLQEDGTDQLLYAILFALHSTRERHRLNFEQIMIDFLNMLVANAGDPYDLHQFAWEVKKAWGLEPGEISSRISRISLSFCDAGLLSRHSYEMIMAGLASL